MGWTKESQHAPLSKYTGGTESYLSGSGFDIFLPKFSFRPRRCARGGRTQGISSTFFVIAPKPRKSAQNGQNSAENCFTFMKSQFTPAESQFTSAVRQLTSKESQFTPAGCQFTTEESQLTPAACQLTTGECQLVSNENEFTFLRKQLPNASRRRDALIHLLRASSKAHHWPSHRCRKRQRFQPVSSSRQTTNPRRDKNHPERQTALTGA